MKKSTPTHCPLCGQKLISLSYAWVCQQGAQNPFTDVWDYHYDFYDQDFRTHERVIIYPNMAIIYTSDGDMNYSRFFYVEDGREVERIVDFPIDAANANEVMKNIRMDSEILK